MPVSATPAPNGEYHHHVSPACLYDHTADQQHSPLIGFAFDGFPIYGAYGYTNTDGSGGISRMRSSYGLRSISERSTLPDGTVLSAAQYGPAIGGQYPLGAFIEDHEYVEGSGDLDEHNGRFCVTPDYPGGTYAYFVTLGDDLQPAYPFVIGPTYYGTVQAGNTGPQSGHNTIPVNAELFGPSTDISEEVIHRSQISPNPASHYAHLRSDKQILRAYLIDVDGRQMVVDLRSTSALDVSAIPIGSYLLRAEFHDRSIQYHRLVIAR
jgi:hypothetical protein